MPLTDHPEPRRSLRHSFEWLAAFWLLVIGIETWRKNHTTSLVFLMLAVILLLLGWRRVHRANAAIAEREAAAAPPSGSDARPIEPAGGWSAGRLILFPVLVIAVLLEFRPLADAALRLSPYRLLRAARDAPAPLQAGDEVWVRMARRRARAGDVIGLWEERHRWRLAIVVGAPGDTVAGDRPYDWVERDRFDRVVGVAYRVTTPKAVPTDSIAVTIRAPAADARPEAEMLPASDAQALALRIVFPPSRWRLLH